MNKNMILNTVISATLGGVVGGVVTYISVRNTFRARAQEEVESVKRQWALIRKDPETVASVLDRPPFDMNQYPEDVREAVVDYSPSAETDPEAIDDEGVDYPFGNAVSVQDTEDVMEDYVRETDKPYLISRAEHEEGVPGFDNVGLVYYEEDDILSDDQDMSIDDVDYLVGVQHLTMFGKLSSDKDLVYVRNENTATDYEIVRNRGSWMKQVHGVDIDDDDRAPLRMRDSDQ